MLAVRLTLDGLFEVAAVEDEDGKGDPVVATALYCNGRGRIKLGLLAS